MEIKTPRHVKKPGGLWKRVENHDELQAALKDGWKVRLDQQPPAPVSDASDPAPPPVRVVVGGPDLHNPQADPVSQQPAEVPEPEPEPESETDADLDEVEQDDLDALDDPAAVPAKRGRPRRDAAKKK